MINTLKKLLENLEKEGRYVEIRVQEIFPTFISYSKKELNAISQHHFIYGNVRIFEKGYWLFYSFNGTNWDECLKGVQKLVSQLEYLPSKKGNILKSQKVVDSIETTSLKDPQKFSLEEKNQILKNYHQLLLDQKGISDTRAIYKDQLSLSYFVNTEGSEITQKKQLTGTALYAIAKDGSIIQQQGVSHAQYGGLEVIEGLEDKILQAGKTAVDLLKAEPLPKGKYQVILDNQMSGVFAHEAFGHLSEADFVYENDSIQEMMKLGSVFGVEELNLIDDGSLEKLVGYTPYDDEGVKARKNYLLKNGKLSGRLHSRETAATMGESLSGNARSLNALYSPLVRMTNTYIDKGSSTKEDLFSKVEEGIYCVNYVGGMTNLERFTFTPALTYRIKEGKITTACSNVMLAGNVFETLRQIEGVGDDLQHFGTLGGCGKGGQSGLPVTIGGPHLLLRDVLVG